MSVFLSACVRVLIREFGRSKTLLTTICSLYKVGLNMMKRLAVLIFIFVVSCNVLTGTPIYAQKSEMMKCCKSAHQSGDSAKIAAANLCCIVNCPQSSAATNPTTRLQMTNFVSFVSNFYRFDFQKRTISPRLIKRHFYPSQLFSPISPPLYLRHSAFLI